MSGISASENDSDQEVPVKKKKISDSVGVSVKKGDGSAETMAPDDGRSALGDGMAGSTQPREIQDGHTLGGRARSHRENSGALSHAKIDKGQSDRDQDFHLSALPMPEVFDFSNLSYKDRLDEIYDVIIIDCKPFEVQGAFATHIQELELADVLTGKQAVWRSVDLECDVLVEVKEVQTTFYPIMMKVEVVEPFRCVPSTTCGSITWEQVSSYLKDHENEVDIVELFLVHDDSGDLDEAALAIEHTRFFFNYIWRYSDEHDDGDYYFNSRHLQPRLKLYYDVLEKKVSPALALMYEGAMLEYKTKVRLLSQMQARLYDEDDEDDDEDMDIDDHEDSDEDQDNDKDGCKGRDSDKEKGSDMTKNNDKKDKDSDKDEGSDGRNYKEDSNVPKKEFDELELLELARLEKDIGHLEDTLETMENPVMRYLLELPKDRRRRLNSSVEIRQMRQHKEPVTHIVGEKITAAMIQDLQLPAEAIVETHQTTASALAGCYDNDTVLIFPGTYCGDGFDRLKQSLTIRGVTKPKDVVITRKSYDRDTPFLGCFSDLSLSNLTFVDEADSAKDWLGVEVGCGPTTLKNCHFKCGAFGIRVFNCSLKIEDCEVSGAKGPGVKVFRGAKLSMKGCYIHHCGKKRSRSSLFAEEKCGVLIETPQNPGEKSERRKTSVKIHGCKIQHNTGPGILLRIWSDALKKAAKVSDLNDLCTLTCIDLQVNDTNLKGNSKGVAMVEYK